VKKKTLVEVYFIANAV